MDSPSAQPQSLEEIRREIDRIDDAILKLVGERLAMVDRVRAQKNNADGAQSTPIRPGREAAILRRIIKEAAGRVPAELCFRLWRALISTATQRQAPVRVHCPTGLFASPNAHLMVAGHFGFAELVSHTEEAAALKAVAEVPGDVAAVAIDGSWIGPFLDGLAGSAQVIGCLPFLSRETMPRILIFGHAPPEPTGADETLIITDHALLDDFAPRPHWQMETGGRRLASLPGFLSEENMPLALTVVGRYPSPIEVRS